MAIDYPAKPDLFVFLPFSNDARLSGANYYKSRVGIASVLLNYVLRKND